MSPQELVAGLRQSDPAARQELRKRFHADFLGMAEDCIRRFELDAEARVLASRLLKSIELWLTHPKKSLVRGMKWPALAAHVAKKAEELLTGPYVYNERLPGGLSATASRRAPRGLLTAGRYVIRWFSKALDTALGDVWDFEERPNGAMILLLGDVMGHGLLASLVAQVVGDLFREFLTAQRDPVDLAALHAQLERQLSPVLSPTPSGVSVDDDCYIQTTLVAFEPNPERAIGTTFVPHRAIRMQIDPPPAVPTWTVAICADLLGFGIQPKVTVAAGPMHLPEDGEVLIATDGLFDQPTGRPGAAEGAPKLGTVLQTEMPQYPRKRVLLHPIRVRWGIAVEASGEQHDDVCLVSVRHKTDNDDLIARALDGDTGATAEFARRFEKLIWKWVYKFFKGWSSEHRTNMFQEVFTHLWGQLVKFAGGTLQSWVQRVVVNKLCDLVRAGKRESEHAKASGADTSALVDRGPSPVQQAVDNEAAAEHARRLVLLQGAIDLLEADDQQLLRCQMDGLTIDEIAKQQAGKRGWSVRNIKYRLGQIKEFLREHLTAGVKVASGEY